ncbi:MAG: hypothetical protein WCO33_05370 [bacterium]
MPDNVDAGHEEVPLPIACKVALFCMFGIIRRRSGADSDIIPSYCNIYNPPKLSLPSSSIGLGNCPFASETFAGDMGSN